MGISNPGWSLGCKEQPLLINITESSTEHTCAASRAQPAFPTGALCSLVSKHTMPLFYNWEQANACCPGFPVPCGSAGSKGEGFTAACTVTEATQSPGPSTSLPLLGCIPSRGAEAVHGNQKGKETVVKHATLKIPLKLMRIWLLAMSRAAAGPHHGLELQLNSYIFFPPFLEYILLYVNITLLEKKTTAKQPNASQRHETSPALEPQSHLFNNNNSTYLHSCQSHVTSAWEKTSRLRVYFWQKYCKEIRLTWVEFYLGIWSLSWWLSHHFCQITLIGCQIRFHNPICNLASSLFSRCYLLYTKQTPNKEVCAV